MSYNAFCPPGVVLAFAGSVAPDGWLLCNGALVSRTTFVTLFSAISTAHGSGDGTTTFALPDYRGRFMRGVDGATARDPDRLTRTAAAAGGNTGDAVGSVQGNATAKNGLSAAAPTFTGTASQATGGMSANSSLGHSYSNGANFVANNMAAAGSGVAQYSTTGLGVATTNNHDVSHTHSFTATGTVSAPTITGDNETRPVNANVNYIIKI